MAARKQPCNPQSVGAVAMQKTRGLLAIKIDKILIRNNTQLVEIKIGVHALQRIECPCHPFDALLKHPLALSKFEQVTNIESAKPRPDAEHVRMMCYPPFLVTDKTIRKTC